MNFYGYPVGEIDNGWVRIGYLKHGFLRLVSLRFRDNPTNLFVELPEAGWQTPLGFFRLMGGHRLWVAPECREITYLLEPEELIEEKFPGGVRLTQAVDAHSGLQRIVELRLEAGKAGFTVKHTLVNRGTQAIHAAAWAISQFPLGGIAALPQPDTWAEVSGLLPNRSLALWPYTRLDDQRSRWMERNLMVNAHRIEHPCKVGYFGHQGWGAYLYQGVLIKKQVSLHSGLLYPDMNSGLEIYIDHRFLELESLSPLCMLAIDDELVHEEHWSLEDASGVDDEQSLAEYLDNH